MLPRGSHQPGGHRPERRFSAFQRFSVSGRSHQAGGHGPDPRNLSTSDLVLGPSCGRLVPTAKRGEAVLFE